MTTQSAPVSTPGITTFMDLPRGDLEHLKEGMVAICGVSYDLSCTSRIGSRFGGRAIRDSASYYAGAFSRNDLVEITTGDRMSGARRSQVLDLGDFNAYPLDWPRTEKDLRRSLYKVASTGATPVVLGGDHFISYPLCLGYSDAVRERSGRGIGYIQLSSRLDLGTSDPVWGNVWRGATARRILDSATVSPKNMVWVGINGYVRREEWDFARDNNLSVFTLADIRQQGLRHVIENAMAIAGEGCESVYVSIDFDVMDGGIVAATADPCFDGLTNVELLKAVDILRRKKAGALDLVGMNPTVNMVSATGPRLGAWIVIRFLAGDALAYP